MNFNGVTVVLLGDSLAAGEGAGAYFNGTDEPHQRCHRSAASWFADTGADVFNAGCSRALIDNLGAPQQHAEYNARAQPAQLDTLPGQPPEIALVMIGGNDIRFADIFNQCVLSDADCTSDPVFTSEALQVAGLLSGRLAAAYLDVAEAAGAQQVLVPAYPQVFGGNVGDCGRISPAEAGFARDLTAALNRSVRKGADDAAELVPEVRFVPATEDALNGHGACDADPFVHTVLPSALIDAAQRQSAGQELLHPTAAGYGRLTEALTGWLANNPPSTTNAP